MKGLFEEIDGLYERYLAIWEDICNIESPTDSKEGIDAVGAYFAAFAEAHAWQVERFAHAVAGDVICITQNAQSNKRPLCISGHTDTVHPIGSWGTPAVHTDESRIYGPGVCDCKGGIVAGLMAMEALERIGFQDRPIMLLLQTDEEIGSRKSNKETIQYICRKSRDAVAFLNLEPFIPGTVCLERKGIVNFLFQVKGQEAHASNCAREGANAIADAAHKIIELEKIKDHEGLTCNCGTIVGGSVPNTVAGSCSFKVNVRFATQEQFEWICHYVRELAATVHVPGCQCEVSQFSYRTPMELTERNRSLLAQVNRLFANAGLPTLEAKKHLGGSDAADVTAYGIPCLDTLGIEGGSYHSPEEFAYKASLIDAARRIAVIAMGIEE